MTDDERANNKKIILDLAENSVGLEWAVVFVISSGQETKSHTVVKSGALPLPIEIFNLRSGINNYFACSRCRVLLHLYLYPTCKLSLSVTENVERRQRLAIMDAL